MATIYSWSDAQRLIDKYAESGREYSGHYIPGVLVDSVIMTGDGLKTAIIKGVYLNEWSSGVTIRMYNKLPAKYARIVEMIEEADRCDDEAWEKIRRAFYAA